MPTRRKLHVTIQPATPDDAAFILALAPRFVAFDLPAGRGARETLAGIRADLARTWRAARARHAARADGPFFVALGERNGRIGFAHLVLQRDFFTGARTCHISDLAVAHGYDGRGVGTALLAFAERFALAHACTRLTLSVFPGNGRALALYLRTGFAADLVRMAKPLDRAC